MAMIRALLAFGSGWGWIYLLALGVAGGPGRPGDRDRSVQTGGARGGSSDPWPWATCLGHASHAAVWSLAGTLTVVALVMVTAAACGGLVARAALLPMQEGA